MMDSERADSKYIFLKLRFARIRTERHDSQQHAATGGDGFLRHASTFAN
jgi:hypothetical protein